MSETKDSDSLSENDIEVYEHSGFQLPISKSRKKKIKAKEQIQRNLNLQVKGCFFQAFTMKCIY